MFKSSVSVYRETIKGAVAELATVQNAKERIPLEHQQAKFNPHSWQLQLHSSVNEDAAIAVSKLSRHPSRAMRDRLMKSSCTPSSAQVET